MASAQKGQKNPIDEERPLPNVMGREACHRGGFATRPCSDLAESNKTGFSPDSRAANHPHGVDVAEEADCFQFGFPLSGVQVPASVLKGLPGRIGQQQREKIQLHDMKWF